MPNVFNAAGQDGEVENYEEYTRADVENPDLLHNQETNPLENLKRNQKIALILVTLIAIGVLTLGIIQSKNNLKIPVANISGDGKAVAVNAATETENSDEALKSKDTDGDKLNDYEEINIYDTSPYLSDSDSDGDSDFDEVQRGEDPACPKGQQCFRSNTVADTGEIATGTTSTVGAETVNPTVSAAELRDLLVQSGNATREQVDQIDDKTLLDLYNESVKNNPVAGTETNGSKLNNVSTNTMTTAQIRAALLEQGMDKATLDQIDDATLKQLYSEALEKAQTEE